MLAIKLLPKTDNLFLVRQWSEDVFYIKREMSLY